jgi:hypothetical protein
MRVSRNTTKMVWRSIMMVVIIGLASFGCDRDHQHECTDNEREWIPGWLTDYSQYLYTVQLWTDLHDGQGFHELSHEEFTSLGEMWQQTESVLRYDDPPSMPGVTLFGIYHEELNFVLWMRRYNVSCNDLGTLAQVGETAKGTYNPALTPRQNDDAGNIQYFLVNGELAPRVMFVDKSQFGKTWTDFWGPYDPGINGGITRERVYTVTPVDITFGGILYHQQVKVSTVGPPEDPTTPGTVVEAWTYLDGIGGYSRFFEQKDSSGNVIFRHIATLH